MMEDFPLIEIVYWPENMLKHNGITEVKINFDIYNAPEGSFFKLQHIQMHLKQMLKNQNMKNNYIKEHRYCLWSFLMILYIHTFKTGEIL